MNDFLVLAFVASALWLVSLVVDELRHRFKAGSKQMAAQKEWKQLAAKRQEEREKQLNFKSLPTLDELRRRSRAAQRRG